MAAFAFLAALAAAAAASQASDPRLLNLDGLVTPQDYPRIALERDQQGTVTVRLRVSREGLVTSCKVRRSSGHVALDEQTCAIYRARARFAPATDRRGRPVESEYIQRTTWRLADESEGFPPLPRQAWMLRSTVSLDRNGQILGCKIAVVGLRSEPRYCEPILALAKTQGTAVSAGGIVAAFSISDTHFFPVSADKVTVPPDLAGADKVAQQVSEVTIEPDGTISVCKPIRYSGAAGPETDACLLLKHSQFEPAANGAAISGTIVTTAYTQTQTIT